MSENQGGLAANCRTEVLSDDPAEQDAFGPHQGLADAIASTVVQGRNGQAISLEGTWGSGKSTVIRLLRRILSNQGEHEVGLFVFDAWSHQGDPLRRTFLEKFIDTLANELHWIDEDDFRDDLDAMARRREVVETQTSPALTRWGTVGAVLLFLVPLGYVLFDPAKPYLLSSLGLALILAPVLAVLVAILLEEHKRHKKQGKEIGSKRRGTRIPDIVAIFLSRKTTERTTTSTIRTPDPTSVEFEGVFKRVCESALARKTSRLLIVMDNLDRVSPRDALQIWATMKTFTEYKSKELDLVWLLVPFDPDALAGLWPELLETERASGWSGGATRPVRAFLDKSFQVRFQVPPLLLAGWWDFLQGQLGTAFPDHSEEDHLLVARLFRSQRADEYRVTPREVKLFANKVVALHRLWGDAIPIAVQALHVLLLDRIDEAGSQLLDTTFPNPSARLLLSSSSGWRRDLAALHFNLPPQEAEQILLGPELVVAIQEENANAVVALTEASSVTAVKQALQQLLERGTSEWPVSSPAMLSSAAIVLSEIEPSLDTPSWVWRALADAMAQVEGWPELPESIGKGAAAILDHVGEADKRPVLEGLVATLNRSTPATSDERDVSVWAKRWVSGIEEMNARERVPDGIRVPGDEFAFLAVMRELRSKSLTGALWKSLVPSVDSIKILEMLVNQVSSGQFTMGHADSVRQMTALDVDWDWAGFVAATQSRLQDPNIESNEISALLIVLFRLRASEVSEAEEALRSLADEGRILHHLSRAVASESARAIGLCLLIMLMFHPDGNTPLPDQAGDGSNRYGELLMSPSEKVVVEAVNYADPYWSVKGMAETLRAESRAEPFLKALLSRIAERGSRFTFFDVDSIVQHHVFLLEMLGAESFSKLIEERTRDGKLVPAILKDPFSLHSLSLYDRVLTAMGDSIKPKFGRYLSKGLASISQERWTEELESPSDLMRLAFHLVGLGAKLNLSDALAVPLLELVRAKYEDQADGRGLSSEDWRRLVDVLDESRRETFFRNVRDLLISREGEGLTTVLEVLGDLLRESGVLGEKADDLFRHLLSRVLERRVGSELAWVGSCLEVDRSIIKGAKPASVRVFRERLQELVAEEQAGEVADELSRISASLRRD